MTTVLKAVSTLAMSKDLPLRFTMEVQYSFVRLATVPDKKKKQCL